MRLPFIFRTREFEQMELEFFVKKGEDEQWFDYWSKFTREWFLELGVSPERLKYKEHSPERLSHYSKATTDLIFKFPFGWEELWGIANRTDFDLKAHSEHSGKKLTYFDAESKEHVIPYVIEPSLGVDRALLAFLVDAYAEDEIEGKTRVFLDLHPQLAPVKAAVLPLSKKEPLQELAREIYTDLNGIYNVEYDQGGSIGKRYRRQDEIGTPYCITVDFDSLEDQQVTVRERNSLEQDRIPVSGVKSYLKERLHI